MGKWSSLTNMFQMGWNHQLYSCSFGWIRMVETSTQFLQATKTGWWVRLIGGSSFTSSLQGLGWAWFFDMMLFYVDRCYVEDKLMLFLQFNVLGDCLGSQFFFFGGGGAEHKEFGWLKDMVDRRQFIGARTFVKLINHFRLKFPGAIATWERKIVKVYATKHWLVGMCSWHLLTLELWMIIYIYQASDKQIFGFNCNQMLLVINPWSTNYMTLYQLSLKQKSINHLPLVFCMWNNLTWRNLPLGSCLGLPGDRLPRCSILAQEVTRGGRQNLHGIYTPQGRSFVRNKNAGDLLRMPWDVRNEGRDILDTTGYYLKKCRYFMRCIYI